MGWAGIMSMPRVLSLSKQGELLIAPPVEVEQLRLEGISSKNISLASNQEKTLAIKVDTPQWLNWVVIFTIIIFLI